jgi:23S rRNA pseudouridine2605 synthase
MPKKVIPVPSDFARPKPGAYLKKEDSTKNKKKSISKKPAKKSNFSALKLEEGRSNGKKFDANARKPKDYLQKVSLPERADKPFRGEKKDKLQAEEKMPLNKFVAHCGICSRRDAIELIKQGLVKVNDLIVKEPGYKVLESDKICFENKPIVPQQKLVYYLLNKPKDYITTTDDPEGRKTVMDLLQDVSDKRIFPVGRLDRNTTGLLLLTNDGLLTQKLSHPKHKIKKVYQVGLDKPLSKNDFETIAKGILLEDGLAEVDDIAYINPADKKEIGIEIHIGRNRIVRRIFEHLQYEVKTLDRVMYAGLTKKNIPRGKYRALTEKEIIFLKHFK